MLVKELIEMLKKAEPNALVYGVDNVSGFDPSNRFEITNVEQLTYKFTRGCGTETVVVLNFNVL